MATTLNQKASSLASILAQRKQDILSEWLREMAGATRRTDLMSDSETQTQCRGFLDQLAQTTASAGVNVHSSAYDPMRNALAEISRARALKGFTPTETAMFIFSLKRPLFTAVREELNNDPGAMAAEMWNATELLDSLGLYTTEAYLKSREEVIR